MAKNKIRMHAFDIVKALQKKHHEEVLVPECKTGPSYAKGMLRFDAWVMNKSWANPVVTGYEIKISRSDFLQDMKWRGYLDYCNELYFICPKDLIKPEEVPENVGLRWVFPGSMKIYTKVKAKYREVEIPESIFRYIMMGRIRVTREYIPHDKLAYWKDWLKDKTINRNFGWRLGKTISKRIQEEILDAQSKNKDLESKIRELQNVKDILRRLGIDPEDYLGWRIEDKLEEKIKEAKAGIGEDVIGWFYHTIENLKKIYTKLENKK